MNAQARLRRWLGALCAVPGLSGHEDRVRRLVAAELQALGVPSRSDPLGNLIASFAGAAGAPSIMVIAHLDQLGFVVRRIEPDGLIRVERLGGVPERALAAQEVLICGRTGDLPGVIANKSHHATGPDEKYRVLPYAEIAIDAGFDSADAARAAGVEIGAPVVYAPRLVDLAGGRVAGAAIDDRAGCAVMLELARALAEAPAEAQVHLVWSVQEEFNLRGVIPAVRALAPDAAIQLDLVLATDTPDMAARGEVRLGGGPAISHYSFHGRGTLNGLIPHPALVGLVEAAAAEAGLPLQRSAHVGALTETSYVQLEGAGVACVDLGFPMRYSHSAREVCEIGDLAGLAALTEAALRRLKPGFSLDRDDWT